MHPKALLDACAELIEMVLPMNHPADAVVSRYFREHRNLGPRERATLAETTYAVLRRKLGFERLALTGSGPRARRLAILGFSGDRAFLKSALSAQEKDWLDACLTVSPTELQPAQRHNLPAWLAGPLLARLGQASFDALAEALLHGAPLDLRANALKATREQALAALAAEGIKAEPTPYSPWGLRVQGKPPLQRTQAFTGGLVEVQDEGSQLLALLLDPRRGEMVVDFCAGAGGKTLALGARMRGTGRLYAFDVSAHRLDALAPRLARSGLSNVHPVVIAHERDERVKRLAGKIDRVLVDAPCSGTGTLRRNPDLKWRQSPEAVAELVHKQAAILDAAARLLKPGGRLVYATCSLLEAENEAVARAFTAAQGTLFEPLAAGDLLAALKVPDAASLCTPDACFLRLWPHVHGTDGFFAAVWQRKS
ncbi:MAG TPA: RsmB/NOP family class I SAM-dependent RNA methyltransferase [Burkholderiaceae bacterium]|nr:RsmB/NOP family class I SAM-dependent RNA methyltransferase [Burkholderiaceae bacterium]